MHRNTVYRLIETGQLPALRLGLPGYNLRVDENELDDWLYRERGDAA